MKRFGQVKQNIVSYLTENYKTDTFGNSFKKLFKPIKESKDYKEVFVLYSQVEEASFPRDAETAAIFLEEAIDTIRKKIANPNVMIAQHEIAKIVGNKAAANPIYEAVDTLVYSRDLMKRTNAKKSLLSHLQRNMDAPNFTPVNEAILINLLTNEFNDQFGNINEEEKEKLLMYLNSTPEVISEKVNVKKQAIIANLNVMKDEEKDEVVVQKIHETIQKVQLMESNRYNLYELDNLFVEILK
jgi:hypothetical protein